MTTSKRLILACDLLHHEEVNFFFEHLKLESFVDYELIKGCLLSFLGEILHTRGQLPITVTALKNVLEENSLSRQRLRRVEIFKNHMNILYDTPVSFWSACRCLCICFGPNFLRPKEMIFLHLDNSLFSESFSTTSDENSNLVQRIQKKFTFLLVKKFPHFFETGCLSRIHLLFGCLSTVTVVPSHFTPREDFSFERGNI